MLQIFNDPELPGRAMLVELDSGDQALVVNPNHVSGIKDRTALVNDLLARADRVPRAQRRPPLEDVV